MKQCCKIFLKKLLTLSVLSFILLGFPKNGCCEFLCVQGDNVNLRSSPDQKSIILWEYSNGFPVEVLKRQGDWVLVRDFENDSGWIHKSLLQEGKQVIVKANKNKDQKINIRSGPGTKNSVLGAAYYGVVFTVITKGPWLQVQHDSGLTGWVKAELLWGL